MKTEWRSASPTKGEGRVLDPENSTQNGIAIADCEVEAGLLMLSSQSGGNEGISEESASFIMRKIAFSDRPHSRCFTLCHWPEPSQGH